MQSVFLDFQRLNGTTWFYMSFLLMIAIYFRFSRFFSLRNWDLITLFLFVPGLLATSRIDRSALMQFQQGLQSRTSVLEPLDRGMLHYGYVSLFIVSGYFLVRCGLDLFLSRRPRLEPNLNISGLAFLCVVLYAFLMHEVMIKEPDPAGRASAKAAISLLSGAQDNEPATQSNESNPATPLNLVPVAAFLRELWNRMQPEAADLYLNLDAGVARSTVTLCHLAILAALVLIGWQHFDSPLTGMAMATLFLLLPLTAINVEKIDHLLPSAFLVWAVYAFRCPAVSGALMGLAGVFFYPLFLVPLWVSFYWNRGARRFLMSFLVVTTALWLLVWLLDPLRSFMEFWSASVAWKAWDFRQDPDKLGFWTQTTHFFRLPIFIVFMASVLAAGWLPKEKNLADLIALSVALILGIQFWYADRGGTYIHWYLPLLLLMIFRPNLSSVRPPALEPVPTP